jgi:hypothetical protein
MALGAALLIPRLDAPVSFDGKHSYLPMARGVLGEGWAYMERPESVAYAPLSFLYPALLGANEMLVREANIALYCATIALAFLALKASSAPRAGVIAAFLLAISPTLRPYIADVLTEPPFIFLIAVWALSVAKLAGGGGAAWAIAGGIAFALAALVRPAAMYFAPLAFAFFAWRRQWPLAGLHAIATAGVGLWVLRNALAFGFPAIASGAGAALFFGVNPLVDGFDPPYYGMDFDSGLAQDSASHLSIHADRTLRAVALLELRDTPLSVLLQMFAHKALAFVFVSSTEASGEPLALLRAWRIVLVILAGIGAFAHRKSAFVLAISALAGYMFFVHIPLLYTHRYSVGALDSPLAVLAALGMVEAVRSARRAATTLVASTVAAGIGLVDASAAAPGMPMPDRIPNEVLWLADLQRQADVAPGSPIDIDILKDANSPAWYLTMLQVDLAVNPARPGSCAAMRVRYRKSGEDRFASERVIRVPLRADAQMHRYTVGSSVPLGLYGAGTVRLELECTSAAALRLGTVGIIGSRRQNYYIDRYRETQRLSRAP